MDITLFCRPISLPSAMDLMSTGRSELSMFSLSSLISSPSSFVSKICKSSGLRGVSSPSSSWSSPPTDELAFLLCLVLLVHLTVAEVLIALFAAAFHCLAIGVTRLFSFSYPSPSYSPSSASAHIPSGEPFFEKKTSPLLGFLRTVFAGRAKSGGREFVTTGVNGTRLAWVLDTAGVCICMDDALVLALVALASVAGILASSTTSDAAASLALFLVVLVAITVAGAALLLVPLLSVVRCPTAALEFSRALRSPPSLVIHRAFSSSSITLLMSPANLLRNSFSGMFLTFLGSFRS
mmetsp:Transcript_9937/g.28242  ORF Transcript_9937/g.28242 Transcript_9937/m.28242 type:complete len:294 (+) Transcript_9937:1879-2760(+)